MSLADRTSRQTSEAAAPAAPVTAVAQPDLPADTDATGQPRTIVFVLGTLALLGPLSIDMYLSGLPAMTNDLGTSASLAQLSLSACLVGLALGQLVAGPISDVIGRRAPVLVGLIAYMVAAFLCMIAPNIEALIAFRLLQGFAGAAGVVISRAVVRDLYSGIRAAQFFALLMLVNGLGPILAPLIGGQVLLFTSWRGIFGALVVFGGLIWLNAFRNLPETHAIANRSTAGVRATLGGFGRLLRDRTFAGYALVIGMAMGTMFAYVSGSSFVLQNIYGVSQQAFGLFFAITAVGFIGMSQINARLINVVPMRVMLTIGVCVNLLGASIMLLAINVFGLGLWGIIPGMFVVAVSNGMISPNATALALTDYPRMAGSASALLGLMTFAVGAIVAPIVGIAGEDTAVPLSLVIFACSVCGLAAFLGFVRHPGVPVAVVT